MVELNSKGRVIYRGTRGGEYVMQGGRRVYKFTRASAAPPPPSGDRATGSPPIPGFSKTPYKNVSTGASVYKKTVSGRFYMRSGDKLTSTHLDRTVKNASGRVKTLREWFGKSKPKSRAAPRTPNFPGYNKMGFKARNASSGMYHRMYESRSNGYFRYYRDGVFHLVRPDTTLLGNSGRVKTAREWFPDVFVRRAPPPPRRAPPPPRSDVVNYDAMLKRNTTRLDMAKIRRYAKNWLDKNVPADASYKRAALIIHPDKGNRTNPVNQAKRVALFKLLGGLK